MRMSYWVIENFNFTRHPKGTTTKSMNQNQIMHVCCKNDNTKLKPKKICVKWFNKKHSHWLKLAQSWLDTDTCNGQKMENGPKISKKMTEEHGQMKCSINIAHCSSTCFRSLQKVYISFWCMYYRSMWITRKETNWNKTTKGGNDFRN